MEPQENLLGILEAFIDAFDGGMRIRGIKTVLLIQQATAAGTGISVSEIARLTDAPLENVRRHITKNVKLGNLSTRMDPDDDRVSRVMVTRQGNQTYKAMEVVRRLGTASAGAIAMKTDTPPYDTLIDILQCYIASYPGGMRIRGIKTALLVLRATVAGTGITISELARETNAPLENVRRHISNYKERGYIRYLEDPEDERKARVIFADREAESRRAQDVAERLSRVDWDRLQF